MGAELEVSKTRQTPADRASAAKEKRSHTTQILLQNARLSPIEIEDKTGIPADEAAARLTELLQSRDWMTDRMEERLLLIEMGDFVSEVRERQKNASEENFALIAGVTLRAYREIANRLDARRRLTDQDISEISAAQGRLMMEVIRLALDIAADEVVALHPEIPELREELQDGFQKALPRARERVKKNVRD